MSSFSFQPSDSSASSDALLIFCRAPQLGAVKTRLAASLGAPRALQIYRAMLRDCFDLGRALAPDVTPIACYTPDDAFAENSELRALWDGTHLPQRGADLGARMLNGLADARARGFARALIIGSDAPDLPPDYLRAALAQLHRNDVVVGPSDDGGFVLMGAARPVSPAIFAGITWSRDDVCARLQFNLRAQNLSYAMLQAWQDVDEIADLQALRARLENAEANVARATRAALRSDELESWCDNS